MAESLKNRTVRGLAWQTINTLANTVIGFVIGIVLARLLYPADYGLTAMIGVFTAVLMLFTDGGLTSALIRKNDRTEADLATVFWYNLVTCWLVYAIMFIAAPYIADFYNAPILKKITRVTLLGLLIGPFCSIQYVHLNTRLDFKTPALLSLATNILSGCISIPMAYWGYGVWSLIVPRLFTTVVTVAVMVYLVRWYPKTGFSKASFKELFKFSSGMLGAQIAGRIYDQIAPLIIGKYYSPAQLGVYNRAKGWAELPSTTLIRTLQSVAFPALSKIQDNMDALGYNYRKMIRLVSFVSFPIMVGLAAVASPLTLFVLTEKWADSIPLLQIICFSLILLPVNTLNESLMLVTGRSGLYFKVSILDNSVNIVGIALTLPFGLVAFCYGQVATALIRFCYKTFFSKWIINLGFVKQVGDVLPIFLNSCAMGALCLLVQMPFDDNGIKLLVAIPVGAIYYLVSSYFLYREDMMETIDFVKSMISK